MKPSFFQIEQALIETIGRSGNVDLRNEDGEHVARVVDFSTVSDERGGFAFGQLNLTRIARDMERFLS